jgi:nucleotide-binding universal stress UspA family protein
VAPKKKLPAAFGRQLCYSKLLWYEVAIRSTVLLFHLNPIQMKRIVVPVDFSPYSDRAQQIAVHLAQKTEAKILLVHCIYTPVEWGSLTVRQQEDYPETVANTVEAEIKLSKLAESKLFQGVDLEFRVTHGTPYQQIVQQANRFKADLIVMGTHGNEKADQPFVGSNSQRVIRMATCPVLSIKENAAIKNWKNVAFAAAFEDNLSKSFARIIPLLDQLGCRIHLLFINTPVRFRTTTQALTSMDMFSRRFPNIAFIYHVFDHFDVQSGIIDFLKSANMDWLVMATHDREHTPIYQLGFTESVLFHTPLPVMSLKYR